MTMTEGKNTNEEELQDSTDDGNMNGQQYPTVSNSEDTKGDDLKWGPRLQQPSVSIHQHKRRSATVIFGKVDKDRW